MLSHWRIDLWPSLAATLGSQKLPSVGFSFLVHRVCCCSSAVVLEAAAIKQCHSREQAGDEDGWDEALGYMDACGPGWHLQIARTTSDDGLANESLKSLSNCMLSDSTRSVSLFPLALLILSSLQSNLGNICALLPCAALYGSFLRYASHSWLERAA